MSKQIQPPISGELITEHKAPLLSQHIKIVVLRYFILLLPVILITLCIQENNHLIQLHSIGNISLLNFLLVGGLLSPCLAQFILFSQLEATRKTTGDNRRKVILKSFFQSLPTVTISAFIFSLALVLLVKASFHINNLVGLHLLNLLVLNCSFVAFIGLLDRLKMRIYWGVVWLIYIAHFYLFPILYWLPPLAGSIMTMALIWRKRFPLGAINLGGIFNFSGMKGLLLAGIIWLDKIILYLTKPDLFNPEYIFLSLIPCVLTLNFYYVFVQRKLEKAINNLIWGINNYTISHYKQLNRESTQTLNRAIISVALFIVVTHAMTFFAGRLFLTDPYLLLSKLFLGMIITFMAVLLNIHLYFTSNLIFFFGSILFLAAVNWFVMVSEFFFIIKFGIATFLVMVAFHLISLDLIRRWNKPHRFVLGLK